MILRSSICASSLPASLHAMVFGWLCTWTFHFLFLFWVCCCQKWQIRQNGDTFNLLVPMPSDKLHCIFWGDLESRNPEQSERGLNCRWESVWLLHSPKSRVANCWISSMCLTCYSLHSHLLVHTRTSFYVYKILSKHFFVDWLFTLILWTFSIIFCSNWSFSSFSIAMYLHPHPASFQLSRKAKLTAWELCKRLTDTTRPQITGSESLTGWGELKLWEVFVVLIKLYALLVFPVYLSLNMFPWNCKCKRQNRRLKLSVCALKTNHTLPAREGNWQTQSAWNLCKDGSKVRNDENISLQPVC